MAHISYISYDEASSELRALYDEYRSPRGDVDHVLKIHGPNPQSMADHQNMYRTLMYGPSPLSRAEREMIAVLVSVVNECHY